MSKLPKKDEVASVYLMARIGKNRKKKFMAALLKESALLGKRVSVADLLDPIIEDIINKHGLNH